MKTSNKQRIAGALVLLSILAIFLPVLFYNSRPAVDVHAGKRLPKEPSKPNSTLHEPLFSKASIPQEKEEAPKQTVEFLNHEGQTEKSAVLTQTSEQWRVRAANALAEARDSAAHETKPPVLSHHEQVDRQTMPEVIAQRVPARKTSEPVSKTNIKRHVSMPPVREAKRTPKPTIHTRHLAKKSTTKHKPRHRHVQPKKKVHLTMHPAEIKAWAVQVGTFASKTNAQNLVSRLRKKGYDAYLRTAHVGSRVFVRVYVGPEIRKQQAEQLRRKLRRTLGLHGMVRRYHV